MKNLRFLCTNTGTFLLYFAGSPVVETPLKKQHLLRSASGLSQPTFYRLTPVRIWDGVLKIFGLACTLEASWPCKPAEMGSTPTGSTKIWLYRLRWLGRPVLGQFDFSSNLNRERIIRMVRLVEQVKEQGNIILNAV